jgi:hypothetical protein
LCAILEHELGLAQDNHQRGQTRGNDVTPKSGQESFQVWLTRHAPKFIDATSWEEFHGIADAHGVRLDLRANGFVFTHRRSLVRVKASSINLLTPSTLLQQSNLLEAEERRQVLFLRNIDACREGGVDPAFYAEQFRYRSRAAVKTFLWSI